MRRGEFEKGWESSDHRMPTGGGGTIGTTLHGIHRCACSASASKGIGRP